MTVKLGASLSNNQSFPWNAAAQKSTAISHYWVGPLTAASDLVALALLGALSGPVVELLFGRVYSYGRLSYIGLGCVVGGLTVALLKLRNLYDRSSVLGNHIVPVLRTWFIVFSLLAIAAYLLGIQPNYSRGALILYFVTGAAALVVIRQCARGVLQRATYSGSLATRRVILIGDRRDVSEPDIRDRLKRHGYRLLRTILFDCDASAPNAVARVLETDFTSLVKLADVDEILLAVRWSDVECVDAIMAELSVVPVPIRLLPDFAASRYMSGPMTDIGIAKAIDLQRTGLRPWERTIKTIADAMLALVGLVMLTPLLLAAALMIKLDSPGPVLFLQWRVGLNGKPFRIFKFRTMTTLDDGAEVKQATRGDMRITRVGRWLRASSVDELPQLLNVVLGQMALVGPRPHAVAHDNQFGEAIVHYALRHRVKPGITGWAQVCGFRGETPTIDLVARRVEHDLWYIHNWSFWLDVIILARTVGALMNAKDVY
jgi:Undecaprenyl-phosphate glucose phosphotransferase